MRKEHRYLLKLWTDSENSRKESKSQEQADTWRVSLFDIQFSNEPNETLRFKNIDAFCDHLKNLVKQEQINEQVEEQVEEQTERV